MDDIFDSKEYYKSVDYSLWDDIFLVCKEKLEIGSEEIQKQWSLELYSKYLQVLEVLSINILVVGLNSLDNLFISNQDLRDDILRFKNDNLLKEKFIDQAVFHIEQKQNIKNFEKKRRLYKCILDESVEDYIKDYDFLNAYKHGFRVQTRGKTKISINGFSIGKYNATLTYFSKEKDKKTKQSIVFKNTRCFNWERVLYKSFFILDMLKKLKASSSLVGGEEVTLELLYILNERQFEKSYGTFRFKEPLFISK